MVDIPFQLAFDSKAWLISLQITILSVVFYYFYTICLVILVSIHTKLILCSLDELASRACQFSFFFFYMIYKDAAIYVSRTNYIP